MEKFDIIFILSNPTPTALELVYQSRKNGEKVMLIILERNRKDLIIDNSLINYKIEYINVPYKSVEIRRFFYIPILFFELNKRVSKVLKYNGTVFITTFDLLLVLNLIKFINKKIKIIYQIRDLSKIQLSKKYISRIFSFIETILLKKISLLIVTSPKFYDSYYESIYSGNYIVLENIPNIEIWKNFQKKLQCNVLTIGFIGIIRYKPSLMSLIRAVEINNGNNISVNVIFAGGGDVEDLKEAVVKKENFKFFGAYEYSKDIKTLYGKIDIIYAVYDNNDLNCQLAMPNKFYESIITKTPIIVASNTYVASLVEKLRIGTSIDTNDTHGLAKLIGDAIKKEESWYSISKQSLEQISIDDYLSSHKKAIIKCLQSF